MITARICARFPKKCMNSAVLVLGKNGQVGRALTALLGAGAISAGSSDINLADPDIAAQLDRFLGGRSISAVINAAAYTKVDLAEGEGRDAALRINGSAVGELARWCAAHGVPLVHYSTDYVFPGQGDTPQSEDDPTHPLNAYGASKLLGESAIRESGADHLILRTSWVYDAVGSNFFKTIMRLLGERETLNIVSDQTGAPTYAPHLAAATLSALKSAQALSLFPSGVYHLCGGGETSWHGFANAIFMLARAYESGEYGAGLKSGSNKLICQQILPIPTSAYPLPARRPHNSRLSMHKAQRILGVSMPSWEDGLKECFRAFYAGTGLQAGRIEDRPA